MTIIAAARAAGTVAVASDSEQSSDIREPCGAKVHRVHTTLVGYAGSLAARHWVVEHLPDLLPPTPTWLAHGAPHEGAHLSGRLWLEALAEAWRGWNDERKGWEAHEACLLLLAQPGGLAIIHPDGGIEVVTGAYTAIGSGTSIAYGALHARQHAAPAVAVQYAVAAAITHAPGCGGTCHLLTLGDPDAPPAHARFG